MASPKSLLVSESGSSSSRESPGSDCVVRYTPFGLNWYTQSLDDADPDHPRSHKSAVNAGLHAYEVCFPPCPFSPCLLTRSFLQNAVASDPGKRPSISSSRHPRSSSAQDVQWEKARIKELLSTLGDDFELAIDAEGSHGLSEDAV